MEKVDPEIPVASLDVPWSRAMLQIGRRLAVFVNRREIVLSLEIEGVIIPAIHRLKAIWSKKMQYAKHAQESLPFLVLVTIKGPPSGPPLCLEKRDFTFAGGMYGPPTRSTQKHGNGTFHGALERSAFSPKRRDDGISLEMHIKNKVIPHGYNEPI